MLKSYVIKIGIHWYHCNPTFLWKINFTLVRRLIPALIWDISGLWNRSDGRDFREKRIDISRFLALYNQRNLISRFVCYGGEVILSKKCHFFSIKWPLVKLSQKNPLLISMYQSLKAFSLAFSRDFLLLTFSVHIS